MKYVLDVEGIRAVLPAIGNKSVTEERPSLGGVYIRDIGKYRVYTATNGHILLQTKFERGNAEPVLEEPMILKITASDLPKGAHGLYFEKVNSILGELDDGTVLEIIDRQYPNVDRVIPAKNTPTAREYAIFDPKYLKKVNDFFGTTGWIPQMKDPFSPAMWEDDNKLAVLMPMKEV